MSEQARAGTSRRSQTDDCYNVGGNVKRVTAKHILWRRNFSDAATQALALRYWTDAKGPPPPDKSVPVNFQNKASAEGYKNATPVQLERVDQLYEEEKKQMEEKKAKAKTPDVAQKRLYVALSSYLLQPSHLYNGHSNASNLRDPVHDFLDDCRTRADFRGAVILGGDNPREPGTVGFQLYVNL
jgi:hypothetical protein